MKRFLAILLLAPLASLAATNVTTLGRHDDWTLHQPTNAFFIANSNSVNAVVLHPESSTNGTPVGAGTNVVVYFSGGTAIVNAVVGTSTLAPYVQTNDSRIMVWTNGNSFFGGYARKADFVAQPALAILALDANSQFTINGANDIVLSIAQIASGSLTNLSNGDASNLTNVVFKTGVQIFPVSGNPTNVWWDFGLTNSRGLRYTYQSLLATNDVRFIGPTNCILDDIISINVLASGADRLVMFPTNLTHFRTNRLTLVGSLYSMTLTNGSELRFSAQSNILTFSTIWDVFGQQ